MDSQVKKTALRMIPYGLFVLTAKDSDDRFAAAAINWVTQASFDPPQVVVCVKRDSGTLQVVEQAGKFALNVLGKAHGEMAFTFFKHVEERDGELGGVPYRLEGGVPVLAPAPAYIVCELSESMGQGDHKVLLGTVVDAGLQAEVEGRPDEVTLWLRELEGNLFYGG